MPFSQKEEEVMKKLVVALGLIFCASPVFACSFVGDEIAFEGNDIRYVGDKRDLCNGSGLGKEAPLCPFYVTFLNRVEVTESETANGGVKIEKTYYKRGKKVKTICEGDCKSPVKKTMRPVSSSYIFVENGKLIYELESKRVDIILYPEKYEKKTTKKTLEGFVKNLF